MEFREEIDRLRGVAILIVVLSHTLLISMDTKAGLTVLMVLRGSTWIFIFVAGYLMAYLRDRYTYASYLKSKVQNVVAPYAVIISLILLAGLERRPQADLVDHFLLGHTASLPLWFIPMIILFYVAFPFYRWLCSRPSILIACAFSTCIISWAMGRPAVAGAPFWQFVYFQSAYLAGMAWSVKRETADALARKYLAPLVILACIGAALSVGTFEQNRAAQFLSMAPLTALLMVVLQNESPLDVVWRWLAPLSFGIFFLHGIITDRLWQLGQEVPVLPAIGIGILITALCGLVVRALQLLLGKRSRLVVGS